MNNNPDETVFGSIGEGLDRLEQGRFVMHCFEGMVRGFFRVNPYHIQRLKQFGREKSRVRTIETKSELRQLSITFS